MIVIQGKDLAKSYGENQVLRQITFSINAGDKVGVVGSNGAGKTTLFRCLSGEERVDSGQVIIGTGLKLGVVEQELSYGDATLEDELMSAFADLLALRANIQQLAGEMERVADDQEKLTGVMSRYQDTLHHYEEQGGYAIENRVRQVAIGLGFAQEDLVRPVSRFSGGQQTRVSLGKLLLRQPDILLLDEPTNHLDMKGSEWLEGFLKSYQGTVLVISHDRYFLEQVATKVLEVEHGKSKLYAGNYSSYKKLKAEQALAHERAYEKQQEFIQATEKYIDRYRAGIKSKQARGRQKQLDRLERLERWESEKCLGDFSFPANEVSGERVLELEEIGYGYDREFLFSHVKALIRRGEKVALVGPNGCGKTTLLKVITGILKPKTGEIRYGSRVSIAYYSQQHEDLSGENLVLEEVVQKTHLGEKEARSYLGRFLFSQEQVFKRVGDLSGGEKSRLALLKLLLKGANFLVMDEPTNHLDIPAKEILEQALVEFMGTVILVSHDRYFLDQVVDKVWEFSSNNGNTGGIIEYLGNYSYYRQKKEEQVVDSAGASLKEQKACANSKGNTGDKEENVLSAKEVREKEKEEKRLMRQKAKALEELEQEIMFLEEEKERLGIALADPENYEDGCKAKELTEKYKQTEAELANLYERWELLADDEGQ